MTRWLTSDEKRRELAFFEDYKADPDMWRRAHPGDPGGHGYIDHEVLPLVDALNAIGGVCTLQSCCGHPPLKPGYGPHAGQLWIRLSEEMSEFFDREIGRLLASDVIRYVRKLYSFQGDVFGSRSEPREPHEVIDIQFHGAESGRMDEAERVLVAFFWGCAVPGVDATTEPKVEAISQAALSGRVREEERER